MCDILKTKILDPRFIFQTFLKIILFLSKILLVPSDWEFCFNFCWSTTFLKELLRNDLPVTKDVLNLR